MRPLTEIIEEHEEIDQALEAMRKEMEQSAIKIDVRDQFVIMDQFILSACFQLLELILANAPEEVQAQARTDFQQWATWQRTMLAYQLLESKRASITGGGRLIVPGN